MACAPEESHVTSLDGAASHLRALEAAYGSQLFVRCRASSADSDDLPG